jgi:hypothetical protein
VTSERHLWWSEKKIYHWNRLMEWRMG